MPLTIPLVYDCLMPTRTVRDDLLLPDAKFTRYGDVLSLLSEDALSLWLARFKRSASEIAQRRIACAQAHAESSGAPRDRLASEVAHLDDYLAQLSDILAPFGDIEPPSSPGSYAGLRVGLAEHTDITGYNTNAHRDWCWGDRENADSLAIACELLAERSDEPIEKVLVIGCGAGRLAFDVHQTLAPMTTLALDINPLLIALAHAISTGHKVHLTEFPAAPRSPSELGFKNELVLDANAARPRSGLRYAVGDAFSAALRPHAFDLVITPWFVDIVPQSVASTAYRVNSLLRPGGLWLNTGSSAFAANRSGDFSHPAECQSQAEAIEVVSASGFELRQSRDDQIDYLCSPHSRQSRRELVHSWLSQKTSESLPVHAESAAQVPDWLATDVEPIPALEAFRYQAEATKIHAYVMALIDGERSIERIADVFEKQNLMPAAEARPAIRDMLTTMWREAVRL